MLTAVLTIRNKSGFHARAASSFVKLASRYKSEVIVKKDGIVANGKSVLGLMMLAAGYNSQVELATTGEDEALSLQELSALVENGFGESPS